MKDLIVDKLAYCKLFLHLAKYPHLSCNGVLLSKKSNNQSVQFVDCVPLFHSSITLAPAFEIALNQIDIYCQQNDLEISGYYHASESLNDNQPNMVCYKIAEKLKENCSNCFVFMINNHKIHPSNGEPCFKVYNYVDQRLKEATSNLLLEQSTYDLCIHLLNEKKFNLINDFDNHLDNIKSDWRNLSINKFISTASTEIESLYAK